MATLIGEFAGLENWDNIMEWVGKRRLKFQSFNGSKVDLILYQDK